MNKSLQATAMSRLNLWMLRWLSPMVTDLGLLGLFGAVILYGSGRPASDLILGATGLILLA